VRELASARDEGSSDLAINGAGVTIRHPSLDSDIVVPLGDIRVVATGDVWTTRERFYIAREQGGLYPVGTPWYAWKGDDKGWAQDAARRHGTHRATALAFRTDQPEAVAMAFAHAGVREGLSYDDWAHIIANGPRRFVPRDVS
jgi:hypothetical protein